MTFGSQTDESTAARIVDVCIDRGINFFDTANVYNLGQSEIIVGNLLKGRRNRVVLASKVGMKMGDGHGESGLSTAAILKNVDESLRRLQSNYLDIYYLHLPDYSVPIENSLEALVRLVRAGKVRYPAVSNYAAWQVCRILWLCDERGYQPPAISQPMYNLLARGVEEEYVPFCKELGVSIVAYNPLARGLLTGKLGRSALLSGVPSCNDQWAVDRYRHPAYFDAVDELREIAARIDRSMIDLSISWLLHHTITDCVVLGVENVEQLEQNLAVLDGGPLPAQTVTQCDAVWQKLRRVTPKYNR
jgi:1-deoxyxylulose-5-phosphate synthase